MRTNEYADETPPEGLTPPVVETIAHAADMGLTFYTGKQFPEQYRGGLFSAQRGSWNRTVPAGARVMFTPFAADGSGPSGETVPSPKAGWTRKPASTTAASLTSPSSRMARCWSVTTPPAPSIASPTGQVSRRAAVLAAGRRPSEEYRMPIALVSHRRLCCALPLLLCLAPSLQAADFAADKAKAKMCAACHGIDGLAKVADAPNRRQRRALPARQLQAFRSGERKHPQMSVIAAGLGDDDIAAVTRWYSSIKVSVELPE